MELTTIDAWITARNRMIRTGGIMDTSQLDFIHTVQGYAAQLETELPRMTLAQLEGFTELLNTLMSIKRQQLAAYVQSN